MKLKRGLAVIRGKCFRIFHKVKGGSLLMVYPGVHANCRKKDSIILGEKVRLYHDVGLYIDSKNGKICIGDSTYINRRSEIKCMESVNIGRDCAISWDVSIMDTDYHVINDSYMSAPINIGDHVWIGCKSTILKGVTIGDGAVIAAGTLVNRDVPPKALVGGCQLRC